MPDNDKDCPPGMKADENGKCIPVGEAVNSEEGNAGDTAPKGSGTNVDASTKDNPADTHDCGDGFTWDGEQCVPSGDAAGAGGGTTGSPTTPGKEAQEAFYKQIEKLMASHSGYNTNLIEAFKEYNTKALQTLLRNAGKPVYKAESAAFGVKTESSLVNDGERNSAYERTVRNPAAWFESAAGKKKGGDFNQGYTEWTINPQAYYETLKKG